MSGYGDQMHSFGLNYWIVSYTFENSLLKPLDHVSKLLCTNEGYSFLFIS